MVRRMLTVQDRAAIAKGLQEGCSLRRTADRIGRSVSVVSREIRRNGGKRGYQPVWQLMRNTPETPDPDQRTRKINAASGPQGPGAGGFEAFQDTPPNRRGDSGQRLVMAVLTCKGSPSAEGAVVSHEAVYTRGLCPPERRTGPSRDHAALEAHQTQAASPGGAAHPSDRGDGQH